MKLIRIFIIALLVSILPACSGNSDVAVVKENISSVGPNTTSSGDDAGFSCKLGGKIISGSGTDQNINAAFHLSGDDKGQIFFRLSDMNNPGNKLQIEVPGKVGSTTLTVSPTASYSGYTTSDYANYLDNPLTVTVSSISTSRVSGTFSGTYTLQKGSGDSNTKQKIDVTDGKFDIPFSTSADWKKLYHAQ